MPGGNYEKVYVDVNDFVSCVRVVFTSRGMEK